VEGIRSVESRSIDGRSNITIQFEVDRDVDAAANDIRDRVSGILDDLPAEADPPDIRKADADADVIIWLNLAGDNISIMELTDYARRYLVDRFSTLGGVARVQLGGGLEYSMRIWVDSNQLAARNLTITDVENTLRSENIELPAGNVESRTRDFRVRIQRGYRTVADFENLVLTRSADGYLVRLRDVARVQTGPAERRNMLRGNGVPMVGIGIVKQSKANTLAVAKLAKAEAAAINKDLPEGMRILQSYDSSVFIESAIDGVYMALFEAIGLVVLVIYLILGSFRATLVPAVAVPVSLVATFIVLLASGFTINLLTLLALVLAIGLVVDDAVVILENIYRHIQMGEGRLAAAYKGTRELGFAVIASTVVLLAVFVPITFLEGDVGRLFSEFAVAISAAVCFSSFASLSLSPMVASKVLTGGGGRSRFHQGVDRGFEALSRFYERTLRSALGAPWVMAGLFIAVGGSAIWLFHKTPSEYVPREDRGAFFILVNAPEGSSFAYIEEHMKETKPQLQVIIDRDRAGDLGVSIQAISRTLESKLGSRRVTTFIEDGEEYDVLVEGEEKMYRSPSDLANIQVRSERTGRLIPLSNLVRIEEFADSASLNRYNRIRSITIEANLTEGYSLGEALTYLNDMVRTELPPGVSIGYKGESLEYITSGRSIYLIFLLALVVVYLAMAAQFESFIHPFVIMLTVPLAIAGALFGLFLTGQGLNIYSQIGMIMLVGLATKNGILIVEFANQLRDAGASFEGAVLEASRKRLRPILMTAMPTAVGAIPLVLAAGAGSEARLVIGIVILSGIIVATAFTLYIIPCTYHMLARGTSSPRATTRELERQLKKV